MRRSCEGHIFIRGWGCSISERQHRYTEIKVTGSVLREFYGIPCSMYRSGLLHWDRAKVDCPGSCEATLDSIGKWIIPDISTHILYISDLWVFFAIFLPVTRLSHANPLVPVGCDCNAEWVIFKLISRIISWACWLNRQLSHLVVIS